MRLVRPALAVLVSFAFSVSLPSQQTTFRLSSIGPGFPRLLSSRCEAREEESQWLTFKVNDAIRCIDLIRSRDCQRGHRSESGCQPVCRYRDSPCDVLSRA